MQICCGMLIMMRQPLGLVVNACAAAAGGPLRAKFVNAVHAFALMVWLGMVRPGGPGMLGGYLTIA